MTHICEHCGAQTSQRYCDADCRLADKTSTGPKACAAIAGDTGTCGWHQRPVEDCEAEYEALDRTLD